MKQPRIAPYGSWKSPVTSDLIVAATIGLGQIAIDGKEIYWIEARPAEGGRNVLVKRARDGRIEDVTPPEFNARTRVHEYGGGAFVVSGGTVHFSNFADQRLYRQRVGAPPQALTRELDLRFGDGTIDLRRNRMICVCEDHRVKDREALNTLVSVDLGNGSISVLVEGSDFYSSPKLHPDGSRLAWLSWNHPNMPWDGTQLWVAQIRPDGSLAEAHCVAGGPEESIFQPEWSPDGVLYFVSDRTGWWNLYRERSAELEPLSEMAAEFGLPQWAFGMSTYAFDSGDRIVCAYLEEGTSRLATIDTKTRKLQPIETSFTRIEGVQAAAGRAYFLAGSPTEPLSIVEYDLTTRRREVLRCSTEVAIGPEYLSVPEAIEFQTEKGLTAYAFYYPPRNADYTAPAGEKPPLLVMSHGGPVASTGTNLRLGIQYWTSRGFAVLDVNYGGSTGYGRRYRERLDGQWGVVDVDDCANGAKALAERGRADPNRLAITGGSAGGYTTLCALTFRNVFQAGASHYGISDLEVLIKDTHKFESRDLDRLIATYPDRRDIYFDRSPLHFAGRISAPVIFFQGLEDKICPPNQSELMVSALRARGLPVAYVAFDGEQHGFRRAENIKRALDGELYFYSRVFGFTLADQVEPVPIENLRSESPAGS